MTKTSRPLEQTEVGNTPRIIFKPFCQENGIFRQLTMAYTPQQKGLAKSRNGDGSDLNRTWPDPLQLRAGFVVNRLDSKQVWVSIF